MAYKKIIFLLGSVVLLGLFIYLFYFPYAYQLKFKSELSPYSIYSFIHENTNDIKEETDMFRMTQILKNEKNQDVKLKWEIEYNGEISQIRIKVNFTKEQWKEKLKLLTFGSALSDITIERIKEMNTRMSADLNSYRWTMPKSDQLSSSDCLCVFLESKIRDKPRLMNQHVDQLAYYAQNIVPQAPRLYIKSINFLEQSFSYEFCFPLTDGEKRNTLPTEYYIKTQPSIGRNSSRFYGNFAATPRFWANLYDSLKIEQKEIKYPIAEVFLDSPFSGKEDKEWQSILYF